MIKNNKSFKSIEKYEKNYLRNIIKILIENSKGKPIIVKAKYSHNENNIWASFIWVKPVAHKKAYTLCNHVNIERKIISKWYNLNVDDDRKSFYIIGYPYIYNHYNIERGGIKIATDFELQSIYKARDLKKDERKIICNKCYEYKDEELEEIKVLSMQNNKGK